MHIHDLKIFLTVARTQSMTRAGAELGMAKSAVSRRLVALEHALGVRLFNRSTRTMGLTADGTHLLERAPRVLGELEALRGEFEDSRGRIAGPLRIAAPTSFGETWLAPVLFDFIRQHPEVDLRVELSDRSIDLVGEGFDLAIRVGEPVSSELIARRLCTMRRVIVASPALLRGVARPVRVQEAEALWPAVAYTNRSVHQEWRLSTPQGIRSMQPRFRFWADSGAMALSAAVHGLGMTITPAFLASAPLAAGALALVELEDAVPVADELFVLRSGSRVPSPRLRALIEHLASAFSGVPPWELGMGASAASPLLRNLRQSVPANELLKLLPHT